MNATRHNAFQRLSRGETSFDFAGRWRRWFAISGLVILVGLVSLGVRGLNFSLSFKGGTVWEVPTSASVSHTREVVGKVSSGLRRADIQVLTNPQTGQRTIKVQAASSTTSSNKVITSVTAALAKMAHVRPNQVTINAIGPSWGASITNKAIRAVIIFLVAVAGYIWLRFEAKMALAALVALVHDILVTVGIYALSGFQVSPDTVIAFLTILGYSLYDTIVVFDKVQENTRGLASTNKVTYTDTVNISMNQVLARSLNTSLVAILPILSILVIGAWLLGATALSDFGLALFIGLTTGAYSSIFIASPLLALLKEREQRYSQIRRRIAASEVRHRRLTPASVAAGGLANGSTDGTRRPSGASLPAERAQRAGGGSGADGAAGTLTAEKDQTPVASAGDAGGSRARRSTVEEEAMHEVAVGASATPVPPRASSRPAPRPRKKTRRR